MPAARLILLKVALLINIIIIIIFFLFFLTLGRYIIIIIIIIKVPVEASYQKIPNSNFNYLRDLISHNRPIDARTFQK